LNSLDVNPSKIKDLSEWHEASIAVCLSGVLRG
jgi:hypothetical protein